VKLRKLFLWIVLGSLAMAATMGVHAIWFGGNDRWLGTMLTVALFSNLALAAAAIQEKRVWVRPMYGAIGLCVIGVPMFVIRIWAGWDYPFGNEYGKWMVILVIWTFALLVAGYLATINSGNWVGVLRRIVQVCVFALAVMMTAGVLDQFRGEDLGRFTAVTAIITGLGIVAVPVLNRVHGIDKKARSETSPLEMTIVCPRCLRQQVVAAGPSRCTGCRLKFTIEIEEPRCPKCDYLLYHLTTPRCPECGELLGEAEVEAAAAPTV
jgi:hypothetical protein